MSKNFMQNGKWIDNPNVVAVVKCSCGGKFIKTRPNQTHCLLCTVQSKKAPTQ